MIMSPFHYTSDGNSAETEYIGPALHQCITGTQQTPIFTFGYAGTVLYLDDHKAQCVALPDSSKSYVVAGLLPKGTSYALR